MAIHNTRHRGFTIVELLIVIVVIAVLAAITIIAFSGIQKRANESASASGASAVVKKVEVYKATNGIYPASLTAADFTPSGSTGYQYTVDGTGANYCVTATTNNVSMTSSNTSPTPQKGGCPGHAVNGVAPVTNFVLNPSAEAGKTNGWTDLGASSTVQKHSGAQSIAYAGAASPDDSFINVNVNVPSAGTYYISAYVYLTSNGASFMARDAMWSNGATWVFPGYNRGLLNQWQRIQASATPASAAMMQLRFYPPANGTIYVDDVMVTTDSSNYADGNTPSWIWNGTPNNATSSGPPQ